VQAEALDCKNKNKKWKEKNENNIKKSKSSILNSILAMNRFLSDF
jgi:hypothetical protein